MKRLGEEPARANLDSIDQYRLVFWLFGVGASVIFLLWGSYGLIAGKTWMVANWANGIDLFRVTGGPAYRFSAGLIGAGVAIFGWRVAYELPKFNRWYEWITAVGCLTAAILIPWAYLSLF